MRGTYRRRRARRRRRRHHRRRARRARVDDTVAPASLPRRCGGEGGSHAAVAGVFARPRGARGWRVAVGAHARSLLQVDGLEASRGALRDVDAEEGADERGWCDVALVVATSGGAPRAAASCDGVLHTACAGAAYADQIGVGVCDGRVALDERIAIFG